MGKKEIRLIEKENKAYETYYNLMIEGANPNEIIRARDIYDEVRMARKAEKYKRLSVMFDKQPTRYVR